MKLGDLFERSYRIVEELGRGAHATVYLGEHVDIGQRVAIKVMHVESPRFTREGRVLASLQSPYTVRLLAFGRTDNNEQYLISEWVDGESLKQYLKRVRSVSEDQMTHIARQVLESLAEAHALNIVHRDIKPGNIMLVDETRVKLLDFGIAKSEDDFDLTNAGEFIGTPRYIAPEIFNGKKASAAVDVFGVGVIMYSMLVGEPPNNHTGIEAILTRHLTKEPYLLPGHAAVSPVLRGLINRMISKDPAERPRDARDVLLSLDAAKSAGDSHPSAQDNFPMLRSAPLVPQDKTIEDASLSDLFPELTAGLDEETSESSVVAQIDHVQPALLQPIPRQHSAPEPTEPPPTAPAKSYPRWLAPGIVVLLLCVAGMLVAQGVGFNAGPTDKQTVARPDDDPASRQLLEEGKSHHQAGRHIEALTAFRAIEDGPECAAKAELVDRGLRERVIDDMLFRAVGATEHAATPVEFNQELRVFKSALALYPDHPRLLEFVAKLRQSLEDLASGRTP